MRPRGLALAQISKRTSNPAAAPPDRPETSERAAGALPGEARVLAAATAAGYGYLLLWVIAEIVAMVTDLAAFIRAAIAG